MTTQPLQYGLPLQERKRLGKQLEMVRSVMADGEWRTLEEIRAELMLLHSYMAGTPSISARIREFPHERRIRRGNGYHEREYRMIL